MVTRFAYLLDHSIVISITRDMQELHQFRIHGKELRYEIELLSSAFPKQLRSRLYPMIEQIQEQVGEIHDHDVAIDRFKQWAEQATKAGDVAQLRKLIKQERRQLKAALQKFDAWWTPQSQAKLQASFSRMLESNG